MVGDPVRIALYQIYVKGVGYNGRWVFPKADLLLRFKSYTGTLGRKDRICVRKEALKLVANGVSLIIWGGEIGRVCDYNKVIVCPY